MTGKIEKKIKCIKKAYLERKDPALISGSLNFEDGSFYYYNRLLSEYQKAHPDEPVTRTLLDRLVQIDIEKNGPPKVCEKCGYYLNGQENFTHSSKECVCQKCGHVSTFE